MFFGVALSFLSMFLSGADENGNLLLNGDFEDGLKGWQTPGWHKTALEGTLDSSENQGPGNASLKLSGDGTRTGYVLQQIKIKPGKQSYRLEGWVKYAGFENSWSVRLQIFAVSIIDGKELTQAWYAVAPIRTESDWCKLSKDFTPPETASYLRIGLFTNYPTVPPKPNTGVVWFDNLSLVKTDSSAGEKK